MSQSTDDSVMTGWPFYIAGTLLMIPPLIPIVAAVAPGWIPLPIDTTVPEHASTTSWTFFLISLGAILFLVNITVLIALHRWTQGSS